MWEYRGIRGEGDPPLGMGELGRGTLLVVGGGRCVWDDLDRYLPHGEKPADVQRRLLLWSYCEGNTIMAVNEIGVHLHAQVNHWTSLHPVDLLTRALRRQQYGYPPASVRLHSNKEVAPALGFKINHVWPLSNLGALSGVYAAKVGMAMGFDEVVMAGCPMDGSGMFHDPPGLPGMHADRHVAEAFAQEIQQNPEIARLVRSMSGMTRELLGAPEEATCAG